MINIINEMGVTENVSVIRFFKANNANYLMYTLNEKDEAGYIKLYAAKMLDNATFSKIEEDEEWNLVKELIKVIVKEAKDNALVSVEDLDFSKLSGIRVLGTRVFKLTEQVSEMLGSNKKTFLPEELKLEEPIVATEQVIAPTIVPTEEQEAQSFEELLEQAKPKVEELFFETPAVEEKILEPVMPAQPSVVQPITETPIAQPTVEPTKKVSTLEELLGQYTEEPKKEEPKVEVTTNLNNEDTVKKLEARIVELETKLAKIQEILN